MAEQKPLLSHLPDPIAAPPMLLQPGVDQLQSPTEVPRDPTIPSPTFVSARHNEQKRKMPQCIAHRGYKAKHPENSMNAFRGAVDIGAHAIETDLHITKDEVVVISHDATLKRCFGRPDKIIDKTWDEIKHLRSLAPPHVRMPRLSDLLDYLAEPQNGEIWLFLDIKLDNDPDAIMRLIAATLASNSPPPGAKSWNERIVLGIWAAKYLPSALQYLEGYPVMHIGFSIPYARHFLSVEHVGFNMLLPMLLAPGGKAFLRDVRERGRKVLSWTVNEEDKMRWCIRRGLDGVITDEPEKYLEVCRKFDDTEKEPMVPISWRGIWDAIRIYLWVTVMSVFLKKRLGPVASRELIRRKEG